MEEPLPLKSTEKYNSLEAELEKCADVLNKEPFDEVLHNITTSGVPSKSLLRTFFSNADKKEQQIIFAALRQEIQTCKMQKIQLRKSFQMTKSKEKIKKFVIGIAAMEVKTRSKPMTEILRRLKAYGSYEILIFDNQTILEQSEYDWPKCDFFICFYSTRFPLEKAINYYNHWKDSIYCCVNSITNQKILWDRTLVYKNCLEAGVPIPKFLAVLRGENQTEIEGFIETESCIELNGVKICKPFIEKPISGDDHNIIVYYSKEQGGGSRRLFRKVGNASSKFYQDVSNVRREGSYVYEEFLEIDDCMDVKVYTVGPNYIHAECRKAPAIDGIVERNADGLEVRVETQLSEEEESAVTKIVQHLDKMLSKSNIVLFCKKGQNVCGLDLIRSKGKFYICDVNGWSFVKGNPRYYDNCARSLNDLFMNSVPDNNAIKHSASKGDLSSGRILKGFICIFRHADRTPKQKLKLVIKNRAIIDLLIIDPNKAVKIKNNTGRAKLNKLELVIATERKNPTEMSHLTEAHKENLAVIQMDFPGTKIQLKPKKINDNVVTEALFICKWGGVLTELGEQQAKSLGEFFRAKRFPNVSDEQVEVFSNNERRVKMTAEALTKAYIQKELPAGMVEENNTLLGDTNLAKEHMGLMKSRLSDLMHMESIPSHWPGEWHKVGNPFAMMKEIYEQLKALVLGLELKWNTLGNTVLSEGETLDHFKRRYDYLLRSFLKKEEGPVFDNTKIPDILDYIRYDAMHNKNFFLSIPGVDFKHLWKQLSLLGDLVTPQEYGIEPEDKLDIGFSIARPLLKKIYNDLQEITEGTAVNSKLYFSSESHLHALLNLLVFSGIDGVKRYKIENSIEIGYLTHIMFSVYEYENEEEEDKYKVVLMYSNGASANPFTKDPYDFRKLGENSTLHPGAKLEQFEELISVN